VVLTFAAGEEVDDLLDFAILDDATQADIVQVP